MLRQFPTAIGGYVDARLAESRAEHSHSIADFKPFNLGAYTADDATSFDTKLVFVTYETS